MLYGCPRTIFPRIAIIAVVSAGLKVLGRVVASRVFPLVVARGLLVLHLSRKQTRSAPADASSEEVSPCILAPLIAC